MADCWLLVAGCWLLIVATLRAYLLSITYLVVVVVLLLLVERKCQHDNVITSSAILHLCGTSGSHAVIFRGKTTNTGRTKHMNLICTLFVFCQSYVTNFSVQCRNIEKCIESSNLSRTMQLPKWACPSNALRMSCIRYGFWLFLRSCMSIHESSSYCDYLTRPAS
jgi:hypothetical protein